ncbi:MAG: hypothetical protein WBD34_07875, partial [Burkholderiaceae bacterium]
DPADPVDIACTCLTALLASLTVFARHAVAENAAIASASGLCQTLTAPGKFDFDDVFIVSDATDVTICDH